MIERLLFTRYYGVRIVRTWVVTALVVIGAGLILAGLAITAVTTR